YHSVLGEPKTLHQATEELATLAGEHQFPFYVAVATIYRGWLLSGADEVARGIEMLREGIAAFLDLGAIALRPYFSARIAVLSAASGSPRACLDLLDEVLKQVDRSGQRWCEAELYRSKGELLSRLSDPPHAESYLQRSLATARQQHA